MDSERSGGREMQAQSPPSGPTLCRTGCGFYAHSAFDGMCSKCYKDHMAATLNTSASSTSTTGSPLLAKAPSSSDTSLVSSDTASSAVASGNASSVDSDNTACASVTTETAAVTSSSTVTTNEDTSDSIAGAIAGMSLYDSNDKPKKKRCDSCRKRVGLTGFDCRCGGHFCSIHRYSDTHQCSFDYRQLAQSEIRKHNPVVAAEKVAKI